METATKLQVFFISWKLSIQNSIIVIVLKMYLYCTGKPVATKRTALKRVSAGFYSNFEETCFCPKQICNDFQNQRLPPPCHSCRAHCCNYILAPKVILHHIMMIPCGNHHYMFGVYAQHHILLSLFQQMLCFDLDNMQPLG